MSLVTVKWSWLLIILNSSYLMNRYQIRHLSLAQTTPYPCAHARYIISTFKILHSSYVANMCLYDKKKKTRMVEGDG